MYEFYKRIFDLLIAILGVLLASPLMLAIFILIKLDSPKERVIYKGERAAKGNNKFLLYKFRTMKTNPKKEVNLTTALNDKRVTQIGVVLRKYKFDELPQLINVIKGEMSIVGPRPQFKFYTDKYDKKNKEIMSVKPGITDLASLVFIDLAEKVGSENADEVYEKEIEPIKNELRLRYVNERSLLLDSKILLETFFRLMGIKNLIRLDLKHER